VGQEIIMAKLILPDTDVMIDFFRGYSKAVIFINANSPRIVLSAIVVAELYAAIKGKSEQTVVEAFISLFRVIPVTSEIAKIGGLYRRDFGKSHGIGLADAIIAATCEVEKAELKTLNIKHYPMMDRLAPPYEK
jgi:predicted nucleic acid-binding protein